MVDHGSQQAESNETFLEIVRRFTEKNKYDIVEPAHMDIASPSIEEAFERAVKRGATAILVHPYFLLSGKHVREDIPALTQKAAEKHPNIKWGITEPLGESDSILDTVTQRIENTLKTFS